MTKTRATLLVWLLLWTMGLGYAVAGVCMLRYGERVEAKYRPVTGKIENIYRYRVGRAGKGQTRYSVTVSYEVAGRAYFGNVNYYDSSMREGGPIDLKYDPANPADIDLPKAHRLSGWLFLGCGAVVLIIVMSVSWIAMKSADAPSCVVKVTVKHRSLH